MQMWKFPEIDFLEHCQKPELVRISFGDESIFAIVIEKVQSGQSKIVVLDSTHDDYKPFQWVGISNEGTLVVKFGSDWVLEPLNTIHLTHAKGFEAEPGDFLSSDRGLMICATPLAGTKCKLIPLEGDYSVSDSNNFLKINNWRIWRDEQDREDPKATPLFHKEGK